MSGNKFVRSSKFRHVFGTPAKRDKCYDNIRISKGPHESNMSSVNRKFLAVVVEVQGGGSFVVLPLEKVGRIDVNYPKVTGHKNPVLDVAWNPFNDNQLASASEDCTIKLWDIPDGGLTANMEECLLTLEGHQRKVQHIQWHPTAENVLASAGADNALIVWDVESGDMLMRCDVHPDMIFSISWSYNGSLIATSCKDKKIRMIDPRTGDTVQEGSGHQGNKPSRVVFCGQLDRLFTSGFSRMSERQYGLWDPNDLSKSLAMENIDSASGVLFPFWDAGTNMIYLVGKGDTQIRYFEVTEESVFFLNMYQSTVPGRSVCSMPKKEMDYMKCEVMRFFKLQHTKNLVEPISMTVPRKSDMFQADIFPPCLSGEPALSAEEWIGGVDKDPILMSFGGDGQTVTSSGPRVRSAAAPKKKVVAAKQEPEKKAPARQASDVSEPSSVADLAGRSDPKTLEEYRRAYKELEAENRRLREKLGM
jgi:hypothetical protein